ncbi:hypothetical protein SBOR_8711 [Sclerotinia borealis F-4128]|uniref:Major facilitator superfamily (MFS) profile domain-containing protein n=1 Tax=Sclerotinia borealis (strain F-4128) TaxID=1432307 RepID=W9C7Q5_SCLBF|nr:hypothetical protein SBOR_8711 [Sclerotinia borealis F-4128]
MSTALHRISSGVLAGLQFYDEESISGGHNRMSSRVPDEVQIHEEEKMSESHSSETMASTRFDTAATKKLVKKLDLRLIPILATIYLVCFLDRTNVGNARLDGLEKDLHMAGLDYNIALSVFFPFYIAVGIPSNIIMKKLRPSVWLTTIVVVWSVIMVCMGLVHDFAGLLVVRCFLGIAEGGLYPGVVYYITMWYPRHECGFRMALFFAMATAAGAFGGLFARGISDMSGVAGKNGWSWIFIIEGLLTFCVGCISYWAIGDYPTNAKFLSELERKEVMRRLADDRHLLSDDFNSKYVWQALKDWKIYVNMMIGLCMTTPLYSLSLFLPTIVKDMGYTNNAAQLMTVPPYVVACFFTISASFIADKARQRGIFVLGFQAVAIIGFALLISSDKTPIQYTGAFLAAVGVFPTTPLLSAWVGNNLSGSLKRGVGFGMVVSFANFGGIVAAFIYRSVDAPRFIEGHAILLGQLSISFLLTAVMTTYYRWENARRDARDAERGLTADSYTPEMKLEQQHEGDDATFWRYTV